ncbi:MAG: hypothetical protein SFX72_10685 [Isosphaeraceae bacterium]|nr:hypothetical protein [Isosphaeraceae bacterium]
MKRKTWMGSWIPAALLFAGTFGLPTDAEAQLFPNLTIRRQRIEPVVEPPFYSHVRQNYYGYFPTCWQKFPEGWNCPCPNSEVPDVAAAFKARPRDERPELPEDDEFEMPGDGGVPAPGGAGARPPANNLPALPGDTRSPFELDSRRPDDLPAPNDGGRIRDLQTPPAGGTPSPAPGGSRPMPPSGGRGVDPFAPSSAVSPPSTSMKPSASLPEIVVSAAPVGDAPRAAGRPMLDLPELTGPASAGAPPVVEIQPFPGSLPAGNGIVDNTPLAGPAPRPEAAPAPPARRTSLIGGLFDGLNRRRR